MQCITYPKWPFNNHDKPSFFAVPSGTRFSNKPAAITKDLGPSAWHGAPMNPLNFQ